MPPFTLVGVDTGRAYSIDQLEEMGHHQEPLEVKMSGISNARPAPGRSSWQRWQSFMPWPFNSDSLAEGDTPLLPAAESLARFTGSSGLLLKDETRNPTWSFKDRGTATCVAHARLLGETTLATVSTGNMGHSVAAYAARAGLSSLVFVPHFAPDEKLRPMALHGARIIRVQSPDYAAMKAAVQNAGLERGLRIVSGNGAVRTEGYKLAAFEIWEQLGAVPDFVAVPTSACGHIRGLFKGFRELLEAGIADRLPRMIVVQASRNSPLVTAIRDGRRHFTPVTDVQTIAEAITSGNPAGGNEIVLKAQQYGWLAESVDEEELLQAQQELARAGNFVEVSSAASIIAVKKLITAGQLSPEASIGLMLTGSGLKHIEPLTSQPFPVTDCTLETLAPTLNAL